MTSLRKADRKFRTWRQYVAKTDRSASTAWCLPCNFEHAATKVPRGYIRAAVARGTIISRRWQ